MPKKVSSDFSYTLTYLTLKYERNRIFHPCHENLVTSDFYRQALLKDTSPSQMQNFNQIRDVEWQHLLQGFAIGFLMDRLQQVLVYEI